MLFLMEFPGHQPRLVAHLGSRPVEGSMLLVFRDAERQHADLFARQYEPAGEGRWIIESPSLGHGLIRPASDEDLERIVLGRPARAAAEALLGLPSEP